MQRDGKLEFIALARQRPWLSLWESCQPNRLTGRVPQSQKGASLWCGTLSVCPYGAASSPKG